MWIEKLIEATDTAQSKMERNATLILCWEGSKALLGEIFADSEYLDGSVARLAEAIDTTMPVISNARAGRRKLPRSVLPKLAIYLKKQREKREKANEPVGPVGEDSSRLLGNPVN